MRDSVTATELILTREARERQTATGRSAMSQADISAKIAALTKRVDMLQRAHNGVATYVNSTDADGGLARVIGESTGALHQRCDKLEDRIDQLLVDCQKLIVDEFKSRAPMIYRGVWNNSADYSVGDLVTHGGGGWVCRADHRDQRPGSGGAWQLAIKGG